MSSIDSGNSYEFSNGSQEEKISPEELKARREELIASADKIKDLNENTYQNRDPQRHSKMDQEMEDLMGRLDRNPFSKKDNIDITSAVPVRDRFEDPANPLRTPRDTKKS